jgi:beta-glucosidase
VTFSWGAAFTATQAEGAALGSDWFAWERADDAPPSFGGNGFSTNAATDLRLLRELGLDAVRLTVDWARIEPEAGRVDVAALERYREVLAVAAEAGLTPWVTLWDGVSPGWFSIDERGWRDRHARGYLWPRHVERVADALGDLAAGWIPVLRPVAAAHAAFLAAAAPPGESSPLRFVETVQGCLLGALDAWRVLGGGGAPVALVVEPAARRPATESAASLTRLVDTAAWAWTEGFRDGTLSLPRVRQAQVPTMRDAFDVIAVCFDGAAVITAEAAVMRQDGPEHLLAALHRTAEEGPDRPLRVVGQRVSAGDPRADAERVAEVLEQVDGARADGIRLEGWMWEPAIDGYEGPTGFDVGLGLFDRDRNPKPAAEVLAARIGSGDPESSRSAAGGDVEQLGDERRDR